MSARNQTFVEVNSPAIQRPFVVVNNEAVDQEEPVIQALLVQLKGEIEHMGLGSTGAVPSASEESLYPVVNMGSNSIDDAVAEWKRYMEEWEALKQEMYENIQKMVEMAKNGNVERAFMFAQQTVLPSVMTAKGGGMSILAGSSDIATALREILTAIQNDVNKAADLFGGRASDIAQDLMRQMHILMKYFNVSQKPDWMDESTFKTIKEALRDFVDAIQVNPDSTDPRIWENVVNRIRNMSTDTSPESKLRLQKNVQQLTAIQQLSQCISTRYKRRDTV